MLIEHRDGVAVVQMARPPVNAFDIEFARHLRDALDVLDDKTGAIVLTGRDACFSAGLDLKLLPSYGPAEQRELVTAFSGAMLRLYSFPRPVVAAINGHAIAGGLVAALACDYRIAADDDEVQLGLTEIRVGVPFPAAPLEIVLAELPVPAIRTLVLTGRTVTPATALRLGAIDESRPRAQVLERALDVAREMSELPPRTFEVTKTRLRGAVLDRIQRQTEEGDPTLESWLSSETAQGAARALGKD